MKKYKIRERSIAWYTVEFAKIVCGASVIMGFAFVLGLSNMVIESLCKLMCI